MLAYLDLAIAVLKLVNSIINYFHDRGLIDEGRAQVIAENAAAIAKKVAVRDKIKDEVDAMSEDEVDKGLADLVDPPAGRGKS
jgi:hypothetical protein